MLPKTEWWEVIATYNESIFPLQWISLLAMVCISAYLIFGEQKKANIIIKTTLFLMNAFIGIKFFFRSEGFPLPLRVSQGILFLSIALLIGLDLKWNKLQFQFPKKGWKTKFFMIGIVVILMIYPFVGGINGKDICYWIITGTLPCPTTAYTLLLFITAKRRNNKLLFFLLLVWAVPFPPLVQIPKYHVYEDGIMFVLGVIGLVFLIKDIAQKDTSKTLQNNVNLRENVLIKKIFKEH